MEFFTQFSKTSVKIVFKDKNGIFFGLVLEQGVR